MIFWSSTVEGRFPETLAAGDPPFWNHRIYRTTTRDFQSYAAVELFYEPGFNVIDATITAFDSRYVMVMKNETRYPPAKNLCVAFAEKILGPWSAPSAPFSPQGVWVEGPTVLRVGEWYYVYFDRYIERTYGVMRTKDFQTFEDLSDRLRYPAGMRHGTAFPVSTARISSTKRLLRSAGKDFLGPEGIAPHRPTQVHTGLSGMPGGRRGAFTAFPWNFAARRASRLQNTGTGLEPS